jgi:cytochrome c oxidase subunit 1
MGLSGVITVVGGALFIAVAVATLLLGRHRDRGPARLPAIAGASGAGHAETHDLRGTLVLTFIFLGIFVVIYATHWINLASLWQIS